MGNSIYQRIVDFTASYLGISPDAVNGTDSYSGLGIPQTDMPQYMVKLEDSFGLPYQTGDEDGIIIVDNAVVFIKNKMNPDA